MVARAYNAIEVDAKIISAFLIDVAALCQSKHHTAAQCSVFADAVDRFLNDKDRVAVIHSVQPDEQRKLDVLKFFPSAEFKALVEQFKGLAR